MDATTIARNIELGNFTADDLNTMARALDYARSKLARQNARELQPGSLAFIDHSSLGGRVQVEVMKVKIKKADVRLINNGQVYTVPLSLLETA